MTDDTPIYHLHIAGGYHLSATSPAPLRHIIKGLIEHDGHQPEDFKILDSTGQPVPVFESANE